MVRFFRLWRKGRCHMGLWICLGGILTDTARIAGLARNPSLRLQNGSGRDDAIHRRGIQRFGMPPFFIHQRIQHFRA